MERREDLLAAVVSFLSMMSVMRLDNLSAVYLIGIGSPADSGHGQFKHPIPLYIHLWIATIHLLGAASTQLWVRVLVMVIVTVFTDSHVSHAETHT